ncbi:MAG: Glucose,6-bisphosphate synthase [Ilumatobacteraceae bacterium]|nr:Glucose,6-bisphosphate synthase [Ilumatobacteraceae bacterium]
MPALPGDLRTTAERWLRAEPDQDMRDELTALLAGAPAELSARFTGRLQFGTAGLRGAVGAGPQRMNRLVVRQAAAGLVDHLLATAPDAAKQGVIIGYDARRKSDVFALDTARACAAKGVRALLFSTVVPTPVLAWNIVGVGAAAGVMVTASHNPPADNGYKVYLQTGAQIVPPADEEIAACIDAIDPCDVLLSAEDDPLIERLDDTLVHAYLDAAPAVRFRPELEGGRVAYTALHGVGGATLVEAFARAGLAEPHVVAVQQQPDGTFPTVSFPNPEEPGAMDLLIELAASVDAPIALANDPDADRMAAAIPMRSPATSPADWRPLGGDEIGWLLADHILRHTTGDDRLVITTLVSSSLLSRMAARHGVHSAETFTGFKWIGHTVLERPDLRFVFGYEQALGYLVCGRPLDKDGITAAILLAEVAALAADEGVTLQDRLDAIIAQYGRHVIADRSVRLEPIVAVAAVARLRESPPTEVAGRAVTSTGWYPEAGLFRLQLGDELRLQVRPSGTEPKVKLYGEGLGIDPGPYLDALASLLV